MPNSSWTETGSSISLVPVTTTVTGTAELDSPNYLTNADKIALMNQYSAELAIKTQLDTTASGLSVATTNYDNAVAGINTTLTAAGAPVNWATIWPDGTTSGPWTGIQTSLTNDWSGIATARASLQSAISAAQASQQAAAAQAAAISAAATDATTKMNNAIATAENAAPVVVSSLPVLPDSNYPAGRMVWNTADGQLYRSTGSAWTSLTVSAPDISGSLTAAQIASLAASQITGTLTDAQLAAISAAKVTGTLVDAQIASLNADKLTGSMTGATVPTTQLSGQVQAAQIQANSIGAGQIAAGSITAAQLTLVDTTNLCQNPTWANGLSSWFSEVGSAYSSALAARNGGYGLIIPAGAATGDIYNLNQIPCTPGDTYYAEGWCASNPLTAGSVQVQIRFLDASGSWLTNSPGNAVGNTAGAWTLSSVSATVPAGAATLELQILINGTTAGASIYVADCFLRRQSDASMIVDGSITATLIAANTITAGQIAAGTITGAQIAAGTVTASNIAAATITGTQIAAGTVTSANIAAGTIQASNIAAGTITGDRMVANTVTAAEIAANTITATQIASGTITAGQIAAGAIGAAEIAAGAITAASLTLTSASLIPDPDFASGAAGWAGFVQRLASGNASVPTGCPGLYAGQFNIRDDVNRNSVQVVVGEKYYVAIYAHPNGGSGGAGVGITCYEYKADGTPNASYSVAGATAQAWNLVTGIITPQAGTVTISVGPWVDYSTFVNGASGPPWFTNMVLRKMADASLIVDGTITASKIATGAITADMITTGTLNAASVNVTNLNASNITTGTLSATMVLFPDGSELSTANRVQTTQNSPTGTAYSWAIPVALTAVAFLAWTATAAGASDVFNLTSSIAVQLATTTDLVTIAVVLDGNTASPVLSSSYSLSGVASSVWPIPVCASMTGLSAGSHTIQVYMSATGGSHLLGTGQGTNAFLQRIF